MKSEKEHSKLECETVSGKKKEIKKKLEGEVKKIETNEGELKMKKEETKTLESKLTKNEIKGNTEV